MLPFVPGHHVLFWAVHSDCVCGILPVEEHEEPLGMHAPLHQNWLYGQVVFVVDDGQGGIWHHPTVSPEDP